jgi:hypothetical protein
MRYTHPDWQRQETAHDAVTGVWNQTQKRQPCAVNASSSTNHESALITLIPEGLECFTAALLRACRRISLRTMLQPKAGIDSARAFCKLLHFRPQLLNLLLLRFDRFDQQSCQARVVHALHFIRLRIT